MVDPPFPISHLNEREQNRIREGQYSSYELSKLSRGENPWPTGRPAVGSPSEEYFRRERIKQAVQSNQPPDAEDLAGDWEKIEYQKQLAEELERKSKSPPEPHTPESTEDAIAKRLADIPGHLGNRQVADEAFRQTSEGMLRNKMGEDRHPQVRNESAPLRPESPKPIDIPWIPEASDESPESIDSQWKPDRSWSPKALKWLEEQCRAGKTFSSKDEAESWYISSQRPSFPHPSDESNLSKSSSRYQGLFDASMPPPKPPHTEPEEFFRPNRGWFLGAAGVVAAWILDRVDAPLWLAIITLAVLLICAGIWPWIEKARRRRVWFWALLVLYTIATVVTAIALAEPIRQKPKQSGPDILATPTTTIAPLPSVSPIVTPSSEPINSPSPTPQVVRLSPSASPIIVPSGFTARPESGQFVVEGGKAQNVYAALQEQSGYKGPSNVLQFEAQNLLETGDKLYFGGSPTVNNNTGFGFDSTRYWATVDLADLYFYFPKTGRVAVTFVWLKPTTPRP